MKSADFKAWRARMHYTQDQVAKLLCKKILAIKRYESGEANIPLDVVDALNKHEEISQLCALERKMLENPKNSYRLWKLTPIDLTTPRWKASIRKSPDAIVIPAMDEELARLRAALLYGIAVKRQPSGAILHCPWMDKKIVKCEELAEAA